MPRQTRRGPRHPPRNPLLIFRGPQPTPPPTPCRGREKATHSPAAGSPRISASATTSSAPTAGPGPHVPRGIAARGPDETPLPPPPPPPPARADGSERSAAARPARRDTADSALPPHGTAPPPPRASYPLLRDSPPCPWGGRVTSASTRVPGVDLELCTTPPPHTHTPTQNGDGKRQLIFVRNQCSKHSHTWAAPSSPLPSKAWRFQALHSLVRAGTRGLHGVSTEAGADGWSPRTSTATGEFDEVLNGRSSKENKT